MRNVGKKLRRFFNVFILRISMSGWWKSTFRRKLLRLSGMKIGVSHIGQDVIFDADYPSDIEIGDFCAITMRCTILAHFVHTKKGGHYYSRGKVKLGNNVFMGAHSIICKPVTIGDDVIIAANSVVTKDIPSGEIWGGNLPNLLKRWKVTSKLIPNK